MDNSLQIYCNEIYHMNEFHLLHPHTVRMLVHKCMCALEKRELM